ncbi:MAG: exodeoxyribonuclease V subunit beta [Desulfobacterales bacterium]|nr:exodeoxyribonuclease V subunit beta [Desulfobacterales bacterium]
MTIPPLDPFDLDFERITLIEASAGTGKTYTITTLFARLVALGLPVESILVVTFTEAAAAELKLRIRQRLATCLSSGSPDRTEEDSSQDELAEFFRTQPEPELIRKRLRLAVTCFDQAAVMTIHSFCFSVLRENAFESNTYFDMELLQDSTGFLRQTVSDFFSARINDQDPLFLKFLQHNGITPERIMEEFRQAVSRPGIKTCPESAEFRDVWDQYRKVTGDLGKMLAAEKESILSLIQGHKGVDKRSYNKKNLPRWLESSLELLNSQGENPVVVMAEKGDPLYKFTNTRLALKTKSGHTPPAHPFFDLCEELTALDQAVAENITAVKLEFLAYFQASLEKMKSGRGRCFFDDLINDLEAALTGKGGDRLKEAVLGRYRACLIDEFQDTDPGQYTIFSKLFGESRGEQLPFFMIGDPKQAIYAFRGGDIFAYLAASQASSQTFTLPVNYRSAPLLVRAVNRIFTRIQTPFGFKEIPFTEVSTPPSAKNRISDGRRYLPPLSISVVEREGLSTDRSGFVKKAAALAAIPDILARDMLSILSRGGEAGQGGGTQDPIGFADTGASPEITGRISPGDMAVLVRTNAQAEAVQTALSRVNIPSFLSKTGSVFDSAEAAEFFDILSAVARPGRYLRAALASPVYGWDAGMIKALDRDETLAFQWQDRFRGYRDIWEEKGFVSMISAVFHDEEVLPAPCSSLSERALTNFYHLIELVSQAVLHRQLSGPYLLKWYENQMNKETREEIADELRLESDARAVAIVTIHKSKGLEYPMVFLPYLWTGKTGPASGPALFHDPDHGHDLCLDLGSDEIDRARKLMADEQVAEEMRLLYVALTRASAYCRIYWGGFSGADASALGRLLHPDGCGDDDALIRDLNRVAGEGIIEVTKPQAGGGWYASGQTPREDLAPLSLNRQIGIDWRISSYSAIVASQTGETSEPRPETGSAPSEQGEPILLGDFPKGAGAGDFFHSVLEDIDFTDAAAVEPVVSLNLARYGFNPELGSAAAGAVGDILHTPLEGEAGQGFRLKDISTDQRFTELEFCFDLTQFDLRGLVDLFASEPGHTAYAGRLDGMSVPPFKGFLKGFIDLVACHDNRWYILDYKSNFLGPVYGDYIPESLSRAMISHDYILQYHIYLAALDRYLKLRLGDYDYDTHFGGVFYLFIRGMVPGKTTGIFFDRPSALFLEKFQALM